MESFTVTGRPSSGQFLPLAALRVRGLRLPDTGFWIVGYYGVQLRVYFVDPGKGLFDQFYRRNVTVVQPGKPLGGGRFADMFHEA